MSPLISALQSIPDHRRARGKRYSFWMLLVLIVMGNVAGYREIIPWANLPSAMAQK